MGNICSDGPRDDQPYHRAASQQATQRSHGNSSSVLPRPSFPSASPVFREASSQAYRGNSYNTSRSYSPVVSAAPSAVSRVSLVESVRPSGGNIIQQVVPVRREIPKLFIVGDSITVQCEEGAVQVKCIDSTTAKLQKVHPSSKVSNELSILRGLNHPNIIRLLFTISANSIQHNAYDPAKHSLNACVRDFHNYRDIVWQLSDVVEYLQCRRLVHMALTPDNVFVVEDNRKPTIKIGSFGSTIRLEGHSASVPRDAPKHPIYSAPEVLNLTGVYLASDMYSLGGLIFNVFAKGQHSLNVHAIAGIVAQRGDDIESADVLCADLIRKLVVINANDRLKGDQLKKHPFFWDTDKTVNFIIEINKLIEAGDPKFRKCLFLNSRNGALGGNDDWSILVEDEVLEELSDTRKEFIKRTGMRDTTGGKKNIINLIQVMRHVTVHAQKSSVIKGLMGSNEDFLEYWLERFPYLIQHMYNAKISFETDEPHKRIRTTSGKTRGR